MTTKRATSAEQLPDVPSGTELLDIVWRDLSPLAKLFFADFPQDVDSSWGTLASIERFTLARVAAERARREAAATPSGSCLLPTRKRKARRAAAEAEDCAQLLAAALAEAVRHDWPEAGPEQVWLLMAKRIRDLCRSYEAMRHGSHDRTLQTRSPG